MNIILLQTTWVLTNRAVPHGGFTTAVLYRLSTTHFAHTHPSLYASSSGPGASPTPIAMQLTFLRRTSAGPALLRVEDTKLGARTSTIHVTLSQPDSGSRGGGNYSSSVKVAGYITLSAANAESGPSVPMDWYLHPPPPPGSRPDGSVDLAALGATGRDGAWARASPAFLEFRRAAVHVEVFGPDPQSSSSSSSSSSFSSSSSGSDMDHGMGMEEFGRRGITDQWARFWPSGEKGRWTNEAVAFLVDMFPMTLDNLDRMASETLSSSSSEDNDEDEQRFNHSNSKKARFWYPTVTLNVEFKKRLPPGGVEWLYSRVHSKVLRDGRTDLDVVVLDERGEVVALSNQVALVVSASRNVDGRAAAASRAAGAVSSSSALVLRRRGARL